MRNKEEVGRRVKVLTFWQTHGTKATKDAYGVSRRTLYRWQATLNKANGNVSSLDPHSTAPRRTRSRVIPPKLEARILWYREHYPRIGKKKLTPLLQAEGLVVKEAYIGRCIRDLKERGLIPNQVKLSWYARSGTHKERTKTKVKKQRRQEKQGLEIDTVVRHIDGTKRYTLTAIDIQRRLAYAKTYTSHSSASARDFLKQLIRYMPFEITEIQTDNGSEFAGHFNEVCKTLGIKHYHTYPRCPKMNAYIERFNRTVSEELLVFNRSLLRDDLESFNQTLSEWLEWYNKKRPHESLGLRSPWQYTRENYQECQRW